MSDVHRYQIFELSALSCDKGLILKLRTGLLLLPLSPISGHRVMLGAGLIIEKMI